MALKGIIEAGGSGALVACTGSTDVLTRRYATAGLVNLLAVPATRPAAMRGGGLQAVVLSARAAIDAVAAIALASAAAAASAAADSAAAARSSPTRVQQPLPLPAGDPSECAILSALGCLALANVTCTPAMRGQIIVHGGLPAVVALAARRVGDVAAHEAEDAQRAALMVLVNLAAAHDTHEVLIEYGVVDILLRAAGMGGAPAADGDATAAAAAPSADIRQYATYALANLMSSEETVRAFEAGHVIEVARRLTWSADAGSLDTRVLVIAALRRITEAPAHRAVAVNVGALTPLAAAGARDGVEAARDVAALLVVASTLDDVKRVMVRHAETVATLVQLARDDDTDGALNAIGTIANLGEYLTGHTRVPHFLDVVPALLTHPSLDVRREAWRSMANYASSPSAHGTLTASDALTSLATGTLVDDAEMQYTGGVALRKLATNAAMHTPMVHAGAFQVREKLRFFIDVLGCDLMWFGGDVM